MLISPLTDAVHAWSVHCNCVFVPNDQFRDTHCTTTFYGQPTKFAKVTFSQVSACPQGGGVRVGLCPGGSVSKGVCVQGFSVQEVLCPGASLSRGSLSGGSLPRGLWKGNPPDRDPPYGNNGNKWALHASYWNTFLLLIRLNGICSKVGVEYCGTSQN